MNEVELDRALRAASLRYIAHHPSYPLVATGLDTLRLLDLGPSHGLSTAIVYREMAIPARLRGPTTWSAQLVALIALLGVLARLTGRLRFSPGPRWAWAIPLLTLAFTVPMVGNPIKRAPADPFLILLTALTLVALGERLRATNRFAWPARAVRHNAGGG